MFRVRRAIANLEKTPTDHRRGVYANLIKFVELNSTKVRLGIFAPVRDNAHEAPAVTAAVSGQTSASGGFPGVACSTSVWIGG